MVIVAGVVSTDSILDITFDRFDGGVRVCLAGELDLTSTEPLLAAIRWLSSQYDATQIELDMRRLDFIDVRGVDALNRSAQTVRNSGRMTIIDPPGSLRLIFDVVGGRDHFELRQLASSD